MDPVTQGLLGALSAQLGFRQKIGRDTTIAAALGAMTPDLDVLAKPVLSLLGYAPDALSMMKYHRGISHSIFVVPLIALPLTAGWWAIRNKVINSREAKQAKLADLRAESDKIADAKSSSQNATPAKRASFWLLYFCMLVAVATHTPLDWCTAYGTRLLEPFSSERFAINAIAVVDVFYTGLLLLGVIVCWAIRRKPGKKRLRASLIAGWVFMLASAGYIGTGYYLHNQAIARVRPVFANKTIEHIEAYPALGSIFLWRVTVKTPGEHHAVRVHFASKKSAHDYLQNTIKDPQAGSLIEKVKQTEQFKIFDWFCNKRVRFERHRLGKFTLIRVCDTRYATNSASLESLWTLDFYFTKAGKLAHWQKSSPGTRDNPYNLAESIIKDQLDW